MHGMMGWVFIVISAGVMLLTFPAPRSAGPPLAPSLIPLFSVPFAILYAACQYAYAVWLSSRRAVVLITVLLAAGVCLGWLGRAMDISGYFEKANISYARQMLAGGVCASGLGLGIGRVKGYVHARDRSSR